MINDKTPAGYNGRCPVCGSDDGLIMRGKDGRYRNFCRVMGCPLYFTLAPGIGFNTADDCRHPFETEYLNARPVSIQEYITGKK